MVKRFDEETLRSLSVFQPELRMLAVTVDAEPTHLGRLGRAREAEVIMVLRRPAGDLLTVRRDVYPAGVFRLPTGGVEPGETPQAAARREIYEESGYQVAAPLLLGVVDYTLHWPRTPNQAFLSYVFVADVPGDSAPRPLDAVEVDAYGWLPACELGALGQALRRLEAGWGYWGRFRAVAYDFIQCAIMQYNRDVGERLVAGRNP